MYVFHMSSFVLCFLLFRPVIYCIATRTCKKSDYEHCKRVENSHCEYDVGLI
ncbi:hypothetical protein M758_1G049100 [Ceratodon purpureus]|nr:hypothetical protein M758_1G049100 [Ceratodon purpureus]